MLPSSHLIMLCSLFVLNLLPVGWWMWWYFRLEDKREPMELVFRCFVYGILTTIPLFLVRLVLPREWWGEERYVSELFSFSVVLFFSIAAFFEEMSKHMAVLKVMNEDTRACNNVSDGITYAVSAALGFSFMENFIYLVVLSFHTQDIGALSTTLLFRGLLTSFAHTIFSGIFGYFYAKAYIAPNIQVITRSSYHLSLKTILRKIRPGHLLFQVSRAHGNGYLPSEGFNSIELVIEGLWCAVLLHAIFNLLMVLRFGATSLWYIAIPYIAFLGIALLVLYRKTLREK